MRVFACDSCLQVVKLQGDLELIQTLILKHSMWVRGWPCVNTGCAGPLRMLEGEMLEQLPNVLEPGLIQCVELTPEEMFRALCGYGLPDELGCAPEVVTALLKSTSISGVAARRSRSGRTVLDRLDLDNGTSLHLAASPNGAVVFKVTRRRDELADDQRSLLQAAKDGGVQGDVQHREGVDGGRRDDAGAPGAAQPGAGVDGCAARALERAARDTSDGQGDDGPGACSGGDLQAPDEGLRAGSADGGFDPEQPGESQGDVPADLENGVHQATEDRATD